MSRIVRTSIVETDANVRRARDPSERELGVRLRLLDEARPELPALDALRHRHGGPSPRVALGRVDGPAVEAMRREVVGRESSVRARDGDEETLRPRDDLRPAVVDEREPRVLRELRIPEAVAPDRRVRVEVEL